MTNFAVAWSDGIRFLRPLLCLCLGVAIADWSVQGLTAKNMELDVVVGLFLLSGPAVALCVNRPPETAHYDDSSDW